MPSSTSSSDEQLGGLDVRRVFTGEEDGFGDLLGFAPAAERDESAAAYASRRATGQASGRELCEAQIDIRSARPSHG
jgi:hypothetical protein